MNQLARLSLLCVLALVALTAYGATAPVQPPPRTSSSATTVAPYRFMGTDTFTVEVYGEPDLSRQVRVDAAGYVNLPLINQIKVHGLTVSEAEAAIAKAYYDQRFIRNAQVSINVTNTRPRTVNVQGQVRAPGPIPLPVEIPMTVADAVMKAGGFTDIAKENTVRVTRFSPDGKQLESFTVPVGNIIKGRMENKAVRDDSMVLQPDDIIYVDTRII
jgi:polysaccharide export outer membrane protein